MKLNPFTSRYGHDVDMLPEPEPSFIEGMTIDGAWAVVRADLVYAAKSVQVVPAGQENEKDAIPIDAVEVYACGDPSNDMPFVVSFACAYGAFKEALRRATTAPIVQIEK